MALEEQLNTLNDNLAALIGVLIATNAIATGGDNKSAAAASAPAATTAAAGKGKGKGTRPSAEEVAASTAASAPKVEAATDGFGDEGGDGDPFGMGGDDDDAMGGNEPAVTLEQVKAKFLALRDLAIEKQGKDEGMKNVRTLMNKFAPKLDDIPADKFEDAIAAVDKATTGLNKKK
jgi:hypothetical protein